MEIPSRNERLKQRAVYHVQPLRRVPTHLLLGGLGAGKTSLLQSLLAQRPLSERWAVLINEFGQIGLDAALLNASPEVQVLELGGGCLCCLNGVPFQVGLTRLLREARPQRLLIEPSGLSHPAPLLEQLGLPPWQGVLDLKPPVQLIDAEHWLHHAMLPEFLPGTGLFLINKADALSVEKHQILDGLLADQQRIWTQYGQLSLTQLPGYDASMGAELVQPIQAASATPTDSAIQRIQQTADGWSMGWVWPASILLNGDRLARVLAGLSWIRAKAVVRTPTGVQSVNAVAGQDLIWRPSEWRKDSRLELIFSSPQSLEALGDSMASCVL